jgi:hypothetical protein
LKPGLQLGQAKAIRVRDRQSGRSGEGESGSNSLKAIDSLRPSQVVKSRWKSPVFEGNSWRASGGFVYDPSEPRGSSDYQPESAGSINVLCIGYAAGVGNGSSVRNNFKTGTNTPIDQGAAETKLNEQVALATTWTRQAFVGTKLTGGMFDALVLLFLDFTYLPPNLNTNWAQLQRNLDSSVKSGIDTLKTHLDAASSASREGEDEQEASNNLYQRAGQQIGRIPQVPETSKRSSRAAMRSNCQALFLSSMPGVEADEEEDTSQSGALD